MARTDVIFKNFNNPVIINITGITDGDGNTITLSDFTRIEATFKSDSRNSVDNPQDVVVSSGTQLRLFFGDTTESGTDNWTITGEYQSESYVLTNDCKGNLAATRTC